MTTAVRPERRKVVRIPRLRMIAEEVKAMHAFFETFSDAKRPRGGIPLLVRSAWTSHEELIRLWGGWRCHTTVNMKNKDTALTYEQFDGVQEMILSKFPDAYASNNYWYTNNSDWRPLPEFGRQYYYREAKDNMIFNIGRNQVTVRKGQVTSRAALAVIRKEYVNHPNYVKMWEYFFQQLGEIYAETGHHHVLTVSVAPSDWMHLGHVAGTSCYGTNGGHETSKHQLARLHNTAVVYLWRSNTAQLPEPNEPWPIMSGIARCWLKVAPKLGFYATNAYGQGIDTMVKHLIATSGNWLGIQLEKPEINYDDEQVGYTINSGRRDIYINNDGQIVGPFGQVGLALVPSRGEAARFFKDAIGGQR